ncbi:hypothetical protein AK812_SmicGene41143 [Symbiodinium microadriaticum]|uniref:Uncharacterized protein n=1 Tax=Symbiodinium microadriaticum TaxID=2951 RepID=A0A1Q9C6U6_SYMMI|nr:hypothetical protein AK812_SmicGene41143 [Symbiodinium microadriaticum]
MEARDDRQASSRLRPGRDSTLASGIPLATLPGAARAARVAFGWMPNGGPAQGMPRQFEHLASLGEGRCSSYLELVKHGAGSTAGDTGPLRAVMPIEIVKQRELMCAGDTETTSKGTEVLSAMEQMQKTSARLAEAEEANQTIFFGILGFSWGPLARGPFCGRTLPMLGQETRIACGSPVAQALLRLLDDRPHKREWLSCFIAQSCKAWTFRTLLKSLYKGASLEQKMLATTSSRSPGRSSMKKAMALEAPFRLPAPP